LRAQLRKLIEIDGVVYEVNSRTKTYWHFGQNSTSRERDKKQNEENKKSIDGYTRIFPDGRREVYRYKK
jgi:hypothetical protein